MMKFNFKNMLVLRIELRIVSSIQKLNGYLRTFICIYVQIVHINCRIILSKINFVIKWVSVNLC